MGMIGLRAIHIAAGIVALAVFWIPLVTRKGGRIHRRFGMIYSWAMGMVVVFALFAVGFRLFVEGDPALKSRSIFLAFIAILTAASAWNGLRALRTKGRTAPHSNPWDLGMSALLVLSGIAIGAWGIATQWSLPIIFSVLGIVLGGRQLHEWRSVPTDPKHWWYQHMSGMIAACIGTVTAFLVVNASRIGLSSLGILPWVLPGVVGGIGIGVWTAYYKRKFAVAGGASATESGGSTRS